MLFAFKKFLELASMHALPCYIAFRWAKKGEQEPVEMGGSLLPVLVFRLAAVRPLAQS